MPAIADGVAELKARFPAVTQLHYPTSGTHFHAYVALKGSDIGSRPGCATFLQFQSTEMIDRDLSRIGHFHDKGLRVLQFTHHNNTLFAGGALEPVQTGLTPLGIEGLAEMNRLRILPDVSHGSVPTMLEAARRSTTPITADSAASSSFLPTCSFMRPPDL